MDYYGIQIKCCPLFLTLASYTFRFRTSKMGENKIFCKNLGILERICAKAAVNYLLPVLQLGVGGSKASFTPFVDPRVYQTSPGEDDENSAAGKKNLKARVRRTAVQM